MSMQVIGDDGIVRSEGSPTDWTEIVGEMTRGGQTGNAYTTLEPVVGAGAYDVLGEMLAKSPAFNQYIARRAGASRPVTYRQPLQRARDWDLSFGPVSGGAGTSTTITVAPQCLFRGEKVMATDTASPAGTGTRITQVLIGQRLQRPATGGGSLTVFFANGALGNGIRWDTCQQALSIAVTVSFVSQCTFDMTVFGKAVV
jgi:hypothetical protein